MDRRSLRRHQSPSLRLRLRPKRFDAPEEGARAQVDEVWADLADYCAVEQLYRAIQSDGRPVTALALNAAIGLGGDFAPHHNLDDANRPGARSRTPHQPRSAALRHTGRTPTVSTSPGPPAVATRFSSERAVPTSCGPNYQLFLPLEPSTRPAALVKPVPPWSWDCRPRKPSGLEGTQNDSASGYGERVRCEPSRRPGRLEGSGRVTALGDEAHTLGTFDMRCLRLPCSTDRPHADAIFGRACGVVSDQLSVEHWVSHVPGGGGRLARTFSGRLVLLSPTKRSG